MEGQHLKPANMKIISGILILITAFLSFKHGWEGLTMNAKPGETNMMTELGIGKTMLFIISILSLAVGLMVLFPQTFFAGCLVNAAMILVIMALALKTGHLKTALIEIPFLLMPLLMIYLGHPFKK
jgi:cation transport ATPase